MIFLPKCAAALATLCADEPARYALTGVRVIEHADQTWRLEATDGRCLAILRGASRPQVEDTRAAADLPQPAALLPSAIVPAKAFSEALKAIPKSGLRNAERSAGVLLGRPQILLSAGDKVVCAEAVEGRFPDADGVLPRKPALFRMVVNPDLLIRVLKAASVVLASRGEAPQVELLFFRKDAPLGVITQGDGVVFDALVMPLS